jgi:hypothetical protein
MTTLRLFASIRPEKVQVEKWKRGCRCPLLCETDGIVCVHPRSGEAGAPAFALQMTSSSAKRVLSTTSSTLDRGAEDYVVRAAVQMQRQMVSRLEEDFVLALDKVIRTAARRTKSRRCGRLCPSDKVQKRGCFFFTQKGIHVVD